MNAANIPDNSAASIAMATADADLDNEQNKAEEDDRDYVIRIKWLCFIFTWYGLNRH